jgi:site-specific recombinase XerC
MPSLPDDSPLDANPAEGVPLVPLYGELVRMAIASVPARLTVQLTDVYGALLADSKCENTRLTRAQAIESFRRFLHAASPQDAIAAFLSAGRGTANALALAFRSHEIDRRMAPATINVRLATLRRAVRLARRFDIPGVDWEVDIDELPNNHEVDRRGPGVEGFQSLFTAALAYGDSPYGLQTQALLRVLFDGGLRKNEAVTLDLEHVHLDRQPPALHLLAKGKLRRQFATINPRTELALRKWIEARGDEPGALFVVQPTRVATCRPLVPRVALWRAEGETNLAIAGRLNAEGVAVPGRYPLWTSTLVGTIFWYVPSFCAHLAPLVTRYVREGATNDQIADRLTRAGHVLQRGSPWKAKDVCQYFGTARLRRPNRFTEAAMASTRLARIDDKSVNRLLHKLAKEAGLPFVVRPHGLRHASITRALDLTNGDIRKVQKFARHADPKTTMRYDDSRKDLAGEVSRMLGDDLGDD